MVNILVHPLLRVESSSNCEKVKGSGGNLKVTPLYSEFLGFIRFLTH
jgi:hypothetical protein